MSTYIRFANKSDGALILDFIRELADFEGMGSQVTATAEDIRTSVFERKEAEVLIAESDGNPAAFALFYPVYSTFYGRCNLFLEDLFVREAYRGQSIGRQLLQRLAAIAIERGAKRIDWYVLDDNAAAAEFYKHLGATPLLDRRTYRLEGGCLSDIGYERKR